MNTSQTSTVTNPHIPPYHGAAALTYSEAMDVDTDGQCLANRESEGDLMDTTLDGAQATSNKDIAPEASAHNAPSTTATEAISTAEPEPVLERPRGNSDGGAWESPKFTSKTPHCLSTQPFSCRAWVDTRAVW